MLSKKQIIKIIEDCYVPSPADKAAQILHDKGVTSDDLWCNSKLLINLEDPMRVGVANALRDIERKEKETP
jgi:hypothetical protein